MMIQIDLKVLLKHNDKIGSPGRFAPIYQRSQRRESICRVPQM